MQSWNILTFDPQKTDVDEHIDLINTLGDMLAQKPKDKDKFIDTMPTIIQTHLITCENWPATTKKAKELEHIIRKCDPPAAAVPTLTPGAAVPGLYSHTAQSEDNEDAEIPQPFKGVKPKQGKTRERGKGKSQQKQNPSPDQVQEEQYSYEDTNNYYHTENYRGQSKGRRPNRGQSASQPFRGQNSHVRSQCNQNIYQGQYQNPNYQGNKYQGNSDQYKHIF